MARTVRSSPRFDRLEVELPPGGRLLLEFEGDLWETEDHRNWTDANFKTYSTPIALGPPAPLQAGQQLRQRLVVTPLRRSVRGHRARPRPALGRSADGHQGAADRPRRHRDGYVPADREVAMLTGLAPRHLRVEVRLDRDDWSTGPCIGPGNRTHPSAPHSSSRSCSGRSMPRHCHWWRTRSPQARPSIVSSSQWPAVGRRRRRRRHPPVWSIWCELHSPHRRRGACSSAAQRSTSPSSTAGASTPYDLGRHLSLLASPQIHAFTDIDVVENLYGQAETVRAARAIADGSP